MQASYPVYSGNPKSRGDFDTACNRAAAYANRTGGGLEAAERFLERAGWGGQIHGIEWVECAGRHLAYINTGDTYNLTLCQEDDGDGCTGEVFSGSWGGWYEETENEYCKEEGVVRCACCSEFTELTEDSDWYETVCESCGHYVDGSGKPDPVAEDDDDDDDATEHLPNSWN